MLMSLGIGWATLLILVTMIGLLLLGMPLGFMTGFVAFGVSYLWFGTADIMQMVAGRVSDFTTGYSFVAVPMFVLMASMLEKTGIARDLYNAMRVIAGRLKGGIAVQSLAVAVVLAAMSGIIGGEVVLLGMIALPQMLRLGYQKNLAIGTIVAGGALGTMMPPSIVLIIYGLTANAPIGNLFLAAIPATSVLAGMYIIYTLAICHIKPDFGPAMKAEELSNLTRADRIKIAKDIFFPLMIAGCILGSIYGGIASVTESACMGVMAVIGVAAIRRELTFEVIFEALIHTIRTVGMIIWVGIGATMLIGTYNLMGGDKFVADMILSLDISPLTVILFMMAILIVLGMFLDWIGVAMLTMPIFVPIITQLGYDPVWFGVLFCVNMQVSFLSPPFGPAAFYLKSVAPPGIELTDIFKSVWPYILMQIATMALMIAFPGMVTFMYS